MVNYTLFVFDENVARRYYGQEAKLYCLFVEHDRATGSHKELIHKQIKYITKPVPVLKLQQQLKKAFKTEKRYAYSDNRHILTVGKNDAKAELVIDKDAVHITLTGDECYELETMFFEVLRKSTPTFFAVSLDQQRYGWLKPFKQNIFIPKQTMK